MKCSFDNVVRSSSHPSLVMLISLNPVNRRNKIDLPSPEACTRSEWEWLTCFQLVFFVHSQPSLRLELPWVFEIGGTHTRCERIRRNNCLSSINYILTRQIKYFKKILTPSGMKCPSTRSPPRGTTRGSPRGRGAYILKASRQTAFRYCRPAVEDPFISE